jgi:hypothetical protein
LSVNDFSASPALNKVPYVVDFTTAQPSIPRPFYCTMAYDDGSTGTYFYRHDWFFFHLPNVINLPVSELFVNQNWNW